MGWGTWIEIFDILCMRYEFSDMNMRFSKNSFVSGWVISKPCTENIDNDRPACWLWMSNASNLSLVRVRATNINNRGLNFPLVLTLSCPVDGFHCYFIKILKKTKPGYVWVMKPIYLNLRQTWTWNIPEFPGLKLFITHSQSKQQSCRGMRLKDIFIAH